MMIVKLACGYMMVPRSRNLGDALVTSLDGAAITVPVRTMPRGFTARERAWFKRPIGGES